MKYLIIGLCLIMTIIIRINGYENDMISEHNNMNIRKFLGLWDVSYINIVHKDHIPNCQSIYFYFDDSKQLKFKQYKNKEVNEGLIHLRDTISNWHIKPDNRTHPHFIQDIIYVDEKYKTAIIADDKKKKIEVLSRKDINIDTELIDYVLNNYNLPGFNNFQKIDNKIC